MNILTIAAHPDDEVLGCGGVMARLAREGHGVSIAILGEGATARFRHREEADRALSKTLHTQSREVAALLGARDLFLYELPDNRFDTVPLLEVVKGVEELIEKLRPDVVYTHHGGDLNVDHQIVARAVLTATRPVAGHPVRQLYAFEVPSATDWAFQRLEPPFRPNVFVDISATIELKVQALSRYTAEHRAFPHPRSPEGLYAAARRWGGIVGCQAAEAFELVRAFNAAAPLVLA